MKLSEMATGTVAYDFKFYCVPPASPAELYSVTIMADSEAEAIIKFNRNIKVANTNKGYTVNAR